MKVAVITDPSHDATTEYLSAWMTAILSAISIPNTTQVHKLENSQVTRDNLVALIESENPGLILFHGHGNSREIYGFGSNVLIAHSDNESILENKLVHSLSCDSGDVLGPQCISLGTKAFIGYQKEFKFIHSGRTTDTERTNDQMAKLFLGPAFEIDTALLQGDTVDEAFRRSQTMFANNLQMILSSGINNNNVQACASYLYHDLKHQVALGNTNSSF